MKDDIIFLIVVSILIFLTCLYGIILTYIKSNNFKENKKLKDNNQNFKFDYENDIKELNIIIDEVFNYFLNFIVKPKITETKGIINDDFSNKIILEMSIKVINLLSKDYKEKILVNYIQLEDYIIFRLSDKFNLYAIKYNLNSLLKN